MGNDPQRRGASATDTGFVPQARSVRGGGTGCRTLAGTDGRGLNTADSRRAERRWGPYNGNANDSAKSAAKTEIPLFCVSVDTPGELQLPAKIGDRPNPRARQAGIADDQGPEPESASRVRLAQAQPEHAAVREARRVAPQSAAPDQVDRTCLAAPGGQIGMSGITRSAGERGQVTDLPPKQPDPVQDELPTRLTAPSSPVEQNPPWRVMVRILRIKFGDHLARLARTGRVLRAHNGNSVSEARAAHLVLPAVASSRKCSWSVQSVTRRRSPGRQTALDQDGAISGTSSPRVPLPHAGGFPVRKEPHSTAYWSAAPLVPVHRRQALQWNSQRSREAEHPIQELRETDSQLVRAGIGSCRAGTRTYNKPKVTNVRMPIVV